MPTENRPDLVIVGDSHAAALFAGAQALGLSAQMVYLSGNLWHGGLVRYHPALGIDCLGNRKARAHIRSIAAALGGSVLPADVPVLASFGYHLGRLASPVLRAGFTPDPQETEAGFLSSAFLDAYMRHHRQALLRLAIRAARGRDLTMIAPPVVQSDPVAMDMAAWVTDSLHRAGLRVFDPRREPGFEGPLPMSERSEDGVHGNAAYGRRVLSRVLSTALRLRPA